MYSGLKSSAIRDLVTSHITHHTELELVRWEGSGSMGPLKCIILDQLAQAWPIAADRRSASSIASGTWWAASKVKSTKQIIAAIVVFYFTKCVPTKEGPHHHHHRDSRYAISRLRMPRIVLRMAVRTVGNV